MKLIYDSEVHEKIMHWVNKADFEVSGFGLIEVIGDVAYVRDAILIEQEGSSGETEMKPEAIAKAEYELRNSPYEMKLWWHSHVKMSCFWSGTDMATITQLGKTGWFFHTVFNQKNEWKSAFSCPYQMNTPFTIGNSVYFKDDVEAEVASNATLEVLGAWNESFDKNVKRKVWTSGYGNYYDGEGNYVNSFDKKMDEEDESKKYLDKRNRHQPLLPSGGQAKVFGDEYWSIREEIIDLMDSGWDDTAIERYMGDEIWEYSISLKDIRDQVTRMRARGLGANHDYSG